MKISIISSVIVGVVFGVVSNSSVLLGSWFNIVIWAVVGILIGLFIEQRKYVRSSGLSYGFSLTASFLISGFQGASDKIIGFTLLSIGISLIGACGGWLVVYIGNLIKNLF